MRRRDKLLHWVLLVLAITSVVVSGYLIAFTPHNPHEIDPELAPWISVKYEEFVCPESFGYSISVGVKKPGETVDVHLYAWKQDRADLPGPMEFKLIQVEEDGTPIRVVEQKTQEVKTVDRAGYWWFARVLDTAPANYKFGVVIRDETGGVFCKLVSTLRVPIQELKATLSLNKKEFRSGETLELKIRNKGLNFLLFGLPYTIEYFDENWGWMEVPWLYPEWWLAVEIGLPPFSSYTQSIELFPVFSGTYRISKEVNAEGTNLSTTLTETFTVIQETERFPAEISAFSRGIQLDVTVIDINPWLYSTVYIVSCVTNVNSSEPVFFVGGVVHMEILNREGQTVSVPELFFPEMTPARPWALHSHQTRTVVHRWLLVTDSSFKVEIKPGESYYIVATCKLHTHAGDSLEISTEPIQLVVKGG